LKDFINKLFADESETIMVIYDGKQEVKKSGNLSSIS
jgi:hypothetical protein